MTKPIFLIVLASTFLAINLTAQQGGRNSPPLPPLPQTFETAVQKVRVSTVASGLANPWSLAFPAEWRHARHGKAGTSSHHSRRRTRFAADIGSSGSARGGAGRAA